MKDELPVHLLAFVVITLLSVVISSSMKALGFLPTDSFVAVITSFFCLLALFILFRRAILDAFVEIGIAHFGRSLNKSIGLVRVFADFEKAGRQIMKDFRTARQVRILIQLGRGIIGGDKSLLFETAKQRKGKEFAMKLLYAGLESPYLSRARANERLSSYREWTAEIQHTEGSIEALMDDGISVEARRHSEPFLWKLFFLDDRLFVIPYVYARKNNLQSRVFVLEAKPGGEGSLYHTFATYFDDLWARQAGCKFPPQERTTEGETGR